MKKLAEIVFDEEGKIYLDILGEKHLMSKTLCFYLASEMTLYEAEEEIEEIKEGYKILGDLFQKGKVANQEFWLNYSEESGK